MTSAAPENGEKVVAKKRFAEIANISPGRVSQMIAEGKIHGRAIVGEGRMAKINVALARKQLKLKTDPGQRTGNGAATKLDDETPIEAGNGEGASAIDLMDRQLKTEALRSRQLQNQKLQEEADLRRGKYVLTADAKAQMARVAGHVIKVYEGGMQELASQLSASLKVPRRKIVHELKLAMRKIQEDAAQRAEAAAGAMPEFVEDKGASNS